MIRCRFEFKEEDEDDDEEEGDSDIEDDIGSSSSSNSGNSTNSLLEEYDPASGLSEEAWLAQRKYQRKEAKKKKNRAIKAFLLKMKAMKDRLKEKEENEKMGGEERGQEGGRRRGDEL
jgi:hypothetical protein